MKMKKLLLLIGAVFGTVAGFLFAPRSGKETRSKISKEVKKGGGGIDMLKEDARKVGKDIASAVKELGESEEVKKIYKKGKKKARKLYKKGKKELDEVIKTGRNKVEKELKKGKKQLDKITDKAYSKGVKESKKLKKISKKKSAKKTTKKADKK